MWLLLTAVAEATIVNVLTPSVGSIEDGLHGSVKLGVILQKGNEDRIGANLAAGLRYKHKKHLVSLTASGDYALAFGDVNSQRGFANLRHQWMFWEPVSSLVFAQVDHNRFRGLAVRDLFGAGADIRVWRNDWSEAHLGISVMAEHQKHSDGFIDDDAGLHARMSDYFTVAIKTKTVVLANTVFVQPRLDRWSNWRLLEELSFTVDIAKYLDWNVLFRLERDSRPPTDVEKLDLMLKSGLVLGF